METISYEDLDLVYRFLFALDCETKIQKFIFEMPKEKIPKQILNIILVSRTF